MYFFGHRREIILTKQDPNSPKEALITLTMTLNKPQLFTTKLYKKSKAVNTATTSVNSK